MAAVTRMMATVMIIRRHASSSLASWNVPMVVRTTARAMPPNAATGSRFGEESTLVRVDTCADIVASVSRVGTAVVPGSTLRATEPRRLSPESRRDRVIVRIHLGRHVTGHLWAGNTTPSSRQRPPAPIVVDRLVG
jgi:hypothetical protein